MRAHRVRYTSNCVLWFNNFEHLLPACAVQTSKRLSCGPTWQSYRGRLIRLGDRAKTTPIRRTGVVAAACTQGKCAQHGKPLGVAGDGQPDAREGQAGRPGVAERPVVLSKPGNAGGGKGPQFKT